MAMVRDFSLPMEPKQFRVDPDTFDAPPIIPGGVLKQIATVSADLADTGGDLDKTLQRVGDVFRMLMPGPHGERFAARLLSAGGPDDPPPIDLRQQVLPVLMWLLEEYGLRPTPPSSDSAVGSTDGTATTPNGGTGSTDGASPTETATT
jgi:hypothetical protein